MVDLKIEYVLPTDEYAEYIADNLKGNDYIEVVGLVGRDVRREIKESIKASEWSRVCLIDGEPAVVFGVMNTNIFNQEGVVWMLTTSLTQKHKIFVGRKTKEYLRKFMEHYNLLYNYVDAGNTFTLRWLAFLGATIYEPAPQGVFGLPYRRFEFTKEGLARRYTKSERWCE